MNKKIFQGYLLNSKVSRCLGIHNIREDVDYIIKYLRLAILVTPESVVADLVEVCVTGWINPRSVGHVVLGSEKLKIIGEAFAQNWDEPG